MTQTNDPKLARAKQRAREKIDFLSHFGMYVLVNISLFVINAITAYGDWWFYWPLLGWGVGVTIHFLSVFVFAGALAGLEEKFLKDELNKDK